MGLVTGEERTSHDGHFPQHLIKDNFREDFTNLRLRPIPQRRYQQDGAV